MKTFNYKKLIEDFRVTYRTFEQYESRTWGAEGNLIETYKQIGELIHCHNCDNERLADEILDVVAQMIRLCDFYELNIEEIFERVIKMSDSNNDIVQTILNMVEQIGILSKYIMVKEKYYFRSRVNDSNYMISSEKFIECITTVIHLSLHIANEKNVDLNETSIQARKTDQEWFSKIAKQEKKYVK